MAHTSLDGMANYMILLLPPFNPIAPLGDIAMVPLQVTPLSVRIRKNPLVGKKR